MINVVSRGGCRPLETPGICELKSERVWTYLCKILLLGPLELTCTHIEISCWLNIQRQRGDAEFVGTLTILRHNSTSQKHG